MREIDIGRALLEARTLWHERHLLQIAVLEPSECVPTLPEVEGRQVLRGGLSLPTDVLTGEMVWIEILLPLIGMHLTSLWFLLALLVAIVVHAFLPKGECKQA